MITRLRVYTLLFIVFFIVLLIRLFYWQIYNGSNLSAEARTQYKQGRSLSAQRGEILASDGSWLVASGQSWLIYASIPNLKNDPKKIAEKLAPILIESEDRKDILEGIGFEPVESRIYPEGSSSAQILGFVGKDDEGNDKGYFGIEGFYDLPLSGKPGFISRDADARGIPIILGSSREVSAIKGVNLSTHIDKSVQFSIEKKLKKGIEQYGAVSGTVIVMDPKQGSILGMSSIPSYDPSRYWEYGDTFFNNPAIFSSFEPGSIFKVLIMAAGIDAGGIKPANICDGFSGPYRIDKYSIENWNNQYQPNSTMVDVIVNSDNVGMTFVGEKLGPQMMFEYLTKFKIGEPTGIDLQGEISPKLREKDSWSIVDVATASFGQGIAVT